MLKFDDLSPFTPRPARLLEIETLTSKEKLLRLELEDSSPLNHSPGQFVEVSVLGTGEAPISIASSPTRGPVFELGVRAVGNVTRSLHRLKAGDYLGVRGPFGNGFPAARLTGKDLLFVAGGIGLCPLRSMVQYAVDRRWDFGRIMLLYGCRQPAELLFRDELDEWQKQGNIELLETVDRCPDSTAWEGNVGVITTLFPGVEVNAERTVAMVVGPPVMYRYVVAACLKKGLAEENILLSLERRMKCGMGFCGHCQISNTYVCLDGPVFSYATLSQVNEVEL
jgi:sulfhydrogenase subunit gamma (sulfur reductase)